MNSIYQSLSVFQRDGIFFIETMVIFVHFTMERVEELCCYYISFLRSIALVHQNHHWLTKGKNFYGNHLLFERIYNSAQKDADLMAEKFVGVFNAECLDLNLQSKIIAKMLGKYGSMDLLKGSLKIETEFLEFCQHFYDVLDKDGNLTLGLDDAIMSVSSSREEAVYLLKQASEEADMSVSPVVARTNLLRKLLKK
jgi:hypothetical protein